MVYSLTQQSASVCTRSGLICAGSRETKHCLNKTNLRIAYRMEPAPLHRLHFPALYDIQTNPRLSLWSAVKPQTKHSSVCESKTDLFHSHPSFYSPRFTTFLPPPFLILSSIGIYFFGPFYKLLTPLHNTVYFFYLKFISTPGRVTYLCQSHYTF